MSEPLPSEPTSPAATAKPQIIYVMGSGHSGSTILGVTLGNCSNVIYAGELDNWLTRSGVSVLGGVERTRFWKSIREKVNDESLFGGDAQLYLERSSALLRLGKLGFKRRLRARYRRVTEDLYRAVAQTAGVTHVVDTSHFPLRARELQSLEGIDLYLIFLVREPQAVVASFIRYVKRNEIAQRGFFILSTNFDLWLTNLLATIVFLRHPRERRMFLRHEDFLADPERELRRILDLAHSAAAIPDLSELSTGFPIQGNRLIRSEVVALKRRRPAHERTSRLTEAMQLPWTALFRRLQANEEARWPR
jgi:hypothetical protein